MKNKAFTDADKLRNALRPRMGKLGIAGGGAPANTVPPHTHSADQISSIPFDLMAADDVQEAIDEIDLEKLARDGTQPMLGHLDMNFNAVDNVEVISFDLDPIYTPAEGQLAWFDGPSVHRLVLEVAGGVKLPYGGVYVRVVNNSGSSIGAVKPVRANGAAGGVLAILPAGITDAESVYPLGLTMQALADGEEGWVCCHGHMGFVNTTGAPGWSPGDVAWIGVANDLTPTHPGKGCGIWIRMGTVLDVDSTEGMLFVQVERMPKLGDLSDADVTANGGPSKFDVPMFYPGEPCMAWRDYPASLFPSRAEDADFTVEEKNVFLYVDAAAADVTVTLPAAAGSTARIGRVLHFKKVDATRHKVILDGDSTQTIDGEETISLVMPLEEVSLVCDTDIPGWRTL